jgi:hypothetical protein
MFSEGFLSNFDHEAGFLTARLAVVGTPLIGHYRDSFRFYSFGLCRL